MLHHDFWRSGRWHAVSDEFRLLAGPDILAILNTSVDVRWTMSEASSGQIEYGTTSSYGSTTTNEPASSGLAQHIQTIGGLSPGVTYHFRTKSVSESGVTIYSTDQTVTTTGQQPPAGSVGPRYDFIGGSNFPALPGSYVVVDSSVTTAAQLAAFILDQSNGTTIVLDKTEGGAGTTYNISDQVLLRDVGSVHSGIELWGYNTKIVQSRTDGQYTSKFLHFDGGGWQDLSIRGIEFEGPNFRAGTALCRTLGTEYGHAITITAYDGLTIQDCWTHHTMGEGLHFTQWEVGSAFHYPGLVYSRDADISYNRIGSSGRYGVVINQGDDFDFHHNIVEDSAMFAFGSEDFYSPTQRQRNHMFRDNIFRRWNWVLTAGGYFIPSSAFIHEFHAGELPGGVTGLSFLRNVFEDGPAGYGNPQAEVNALGSEVSGGGWQPLIMFRDYPDAHFKTNVVVQDNSIDLPAWVDKNKAGSDPGHNGNAVLITDVNGLTISGNDFGDMGVHYRRASNVSVSGINGIVDGS